MSLPSPSLPILRATPDVCRALLQDLPDEVVRANYGPNTLSPFDIIGHLIWGDLDDWFKRAKHILEHGDREPFEPWDRYLMYERDQGKSMNELLDEFRAVRDRTLGELEALRLDEDGRLDLPGMHPELGPCTMSELMASWVVHDLHHTAQICKAIARRQFKGQVGIWEQYQSILTK